MGATGVRTATAAVCDPGLAAEAYTLFGSSVETSETWDGVVTSVDATKGTFWARLAAVEGGSARQRAEFELNEVNPDERDRVRPGGVFRWRLDALDVGGKRVRSSKVGFRPLPSWSDRDLESGKVLGEEFAKVLVPDVPLDGRRAGSHGLITTRSSFSAFGPGYGGSLLVHLGQGAWIVDSCVNAHDGLPALQYRHAMDVDPGEAVRTPTGTTITSAASLGCSQRPGGIVRVLGRTVVALSDAIGSPADDRVHGHSSGVGDMRRMFDLLKTRRQVHRLR